MRKRDDIFLIVDDEPDMCWTLEHILNESGFILKTAQNGHEALDLMKQYHFRLVFLDAKLPDIDGLELARRIRKIDPSVRIVLVTGYFYRDDVDVEKALAQGLICSFISKPFLHNEILKAIEISRS